MENNNTFKLKLSKLFQSSFTSCRNKPISDVIDQPFFFPETRHHRHLIDLFSPKPQPISPSLHNLNTQSSRPNVSKQSTLFPTAGKTYSVSDQPLFYEKKPKLSKKKKPHHRKHIKTQSFSSVTDNLYYDCCSSDDDDQETDDETTLFSSRSFSSDSSVSFHKNRANRANRANRVNRARKLKKPRGVGGCKDRKATEVVPIKCKGKGKLVKDSVAVVKKSSDPHEDFRVSMLEMIVERQIFGAKELENLLECFLSLNLEEHHSVICEVFAEIWETLFCDGF